MILGLTRSFKWYSVSGKLNKGEEGYAKYLYLEIHTHLQQINIVRKINKKTIDRHL